jgi:hypothetical protein
VVEGDTGNCGLACKPVNVMELFYSSHPCLTTYTLMRRINIIYDGNNSKLLFLIGSVRIAHL